MGQSEINSEDGVRDRLLEAARALVLRGENKFSIAALCAEAGVERTAFRAHFPGKTALMAALMQAPASAQPVVAEAVSPEPVSPDPVSPQPGAAQPVSKADTTSEPSVPAPDAWLERRLRVFERALNALEAKAEATARQQARAMAQLEERLGGPSVSTPVPAMTRPAEVAVRPVPEAQAAVEATATPAVEPEKKPAPELLAIKPQPVAAISREAMADVLQNARDAVRAAGAAEPEKKNPWDLNPRARWLAIGALTLVVLFLCIGLSLGKGALGGAANARESDGVAHRRIAGSPLDRTIAAADAGDARAQARLALAYLRGEGVASDPATAMRWSAVAARAGQPVAQYLLGVLYQQGGHVPADPARAFGWFASAADKGNLKAMHNLAIAYARGLGTMKNDAKAVEWFTRAAERGYIDSAFDLAVLYERGQGVPQDLRLALKWYAIAGQEGDAAARARADVLRGQLSPSDVKLASNAAMAFAPLSALGSANGL